MEEGEERLKNLKEAAAVFPGRKKGESQLKIARKQRITARWILDVAYRVIIKGRQKKTVAACISLVPGLQG